MPKVSKPASSSARPALTVNIYDQNARLVHVVDLPDPREGFVKAFNRNGARLGLVAKIPSVCACCGRPAEVGSLCRRCLALTQEALSVVGKAGAR